MYRYPRSHPANCRLQPTAAERRGRRLLMLAALLLALLPGAGNPAALAAFAAALLMAALLLQARDQTGAATAPQSAPTIVILDGIRWEIGSLRR